MSVTLNAKGTSVPSFTIGKGGVTIYQGLTDPSLSYSMKDGDYWLDKSVNALRVWTTVGLTWMAPQLGDLHFSSGSIIAPGGQDLTLSVDASHFVNVDSGNSGPALITTNNSQDLHINPATGGGQYLVLCGDRWPAADGTNGQSLKTNGTGILSWYTPTVGTVTSVSGDGGSTGLTFTGSPITSAGTLTLAGTLSAFNGGTGATSSTGAFNNLAPSQVTNGGKFLITDGTNTSWNNVANSGTATIDFGSAPGGLSTSVAITGLTNIHSTSVVILQIMADATSVDHSAAEHRAFTTYANLTYDTPVTGSGFTIYSDASQLVQGRWTVKYSWLNSN